GEQSEQPITAACRECTHHTIGGRAVAGCSAARSPWREQAHRGRYFGSAGVHLRERRAEVEVRCEHGNARHADRTGYMPDPEQDPDGVRIHVGPRHALVAGHLLGRPTAKRLPCPADYVERRAAVGERAWTARFLWVYHPE